MGKRSRDKGKRVELQLAKLLQRIWPRARRSANQFGGADEPDVTGTPYWTEAKGGSASSIRVWGALEQVLRDRAAAGQPKRPILIYLRRDRTEPLVCMLADEWLELAAKADLFDRLGGDR